MKRVAKFASDLFDLCEQVDFKKSELDYKAQDAAAIFMALYWAKDRGNARSHLNVDLVYTESLNVLESLICSRTGENCVDCIVMSGNVGCYRVTLFRDSNPCLLPSIEDKCIRM